MIKYFVLERFDNETLHRASFNFLIFIDVPEVNGSLEVGVLDHPAVREGFNSSVVDVAVVVECPASHELE